MAKENWSPSIQMHSYKPTVKRDDCSLERAFKFPSWRLLLLSAAGKVAYVRICSFTSVRASLCCLHCLNASFLLTHLVLTTESLGVHSSRHMVRGRWSSSLCALPYLYTPQQFSSSPPPQFSLFSVILLLPASTHIWILLFYSLVFHVLLFSVFFFFTLSLTPFLLDSRLHNLFTSQLNCMASTFRWQQTEFLYQRYWAVYKHDFPHRCVLFICVNVSRSSCQQCLLESCK